GAGFPPDRSARPARSREGLMTAASGLAVDGKSRSSLPWAGLLKDALLASLVAVLLALPMVGLQTYDIGGGALGIRTHFDWVAVAAAAVLAGRLSLRLGHRLRRSGDRGGETTLIRLAAWTSRQALPLTLAGIGLAVA